MDGYAVAAHGHPRANKDLDVWVLIDPTNAEHLVMTLEDFGMGSVGLTADDSLEPDVVVQLGYPPLRIDLLTSVSGVTFESCWTNRVTVDVGGIEAGFISAEDLITNKRTPARPRRRRHTRTAHPTGRLVSRLRGYGADAHVRGGSLSSGSLE